ncbi:MAG: hypothetical protein E3J72_05510 [Planctomycetota bacterium]|nr:MAG: hypothetical protein E3J72_05510 [Planctomycetota bacterium]
MAQKPDKKGEYDPKGKKKKKGGKGIVLIIWLVTLIVAFVAGWQYGPSISSGVGSGAGAAAEKAIQTQILMALDSSNLEDEKKTAGKTAIENAFSKEDVGSKKKRAKGKFEFENANLDEKITNEEWKDIIKAFGG